MMKSTISLAIALAGISTVFASGCGGGGGGGSSTPACQTNHTETYSIHNTGNTSFRISLSPGGGAMDVATGSTNSIEVPVGVYDETLTLTSGSLAGNSQDNGTKTFANECTTYAISIGINT